MLMTLSGLLDARTKPAAHVSWDFRSLLAIAFLFHREKGTDRRRQGHSVSSGCHGVQSNMVVAEHFTSELKSRLSYV